MNKYFSANGPSRKPATQGIRPMELAVYLLIITVSLFFLGACSHYSTSGRLPQHLKTVYIPTFENDTAEFYLHQMITDELTERFLSEANLRLGEAEDGDAELAGRVRRYFEEAETFGGRQSSDIEITGRRVTIVLDVEFTDRVADETLFQNRNFSRWIVYEPDKESEREAAKRVVDLLADDLITSILQQW